MQMYSVDRPAESANLAFTLGPAPDASQALFGYMHGTKIYFEGVCKQKIANHHLFKFPSTSSTLSPGA